jgi:hypothetical protein
MDGAAMEHNEMMLRVICFVLDMADRGLGMNPTEGIQLEAYVDSDYAGDQDTSSTRRSITGYVVYFCGVLIAWRSEQQGGVTLSTSEAEYYALSEVQLSYSLLSKSWIFWRWMWRCQC